MVLLTNGYTGALFQTEKNRPVARWLVHRGSELVETTEHEIVPSETLSPVLRFAVSGVPGQEASPDLTGPTGSAGSSPDGGQPSGQPFVADR